MYKKISHIGIVVKDIKESSKFYTEGLGWVAEGEEEVLDQKVKVCFFTIGESRIELVQPTDESTGVYKFLEERGFKDTVHHIAYEVEDIEKELENLKSKGIKLIDEKPRKGAHGMKIAFIHPKASNGVLVEICEPENK
ncbi:MAG: methylmalonyl-CoA epimerase [Proteobacteria bacterium]|nr:methylmalonyl-CoA epimerase [Pseudomonadota bacterium]